MLLSTVKRFLGFSLSITLLEAAQIPLAAHSTTYNLENDGNSWDINVAPGENTTGHLVFETVNSFMQHWPNTRYRNGHSIVPAVVPPGTVLYHGRRDANTPTSPEWLATDPEHSYMFCRGQSVESGCWQLTVTTVRPLKLLYFDGSAAAKMPDGAMDSQDILAYGKVVPEKYRGERERINNLCEWAKDLNVDGFVRMEMDFEIMLCDFTQGVIVEAINLRARARGGPGPGGPGRGPGGPEGPGRHLDKTFPSAKLPPHHDNSDSHSIDFSALPNSGGFATFPSWHRYYPGDTRIQLDLTRLISFYDTNLVPSLVVERHGQERIKHRLLGISSEDLRTVVQKIEELTEVSDPGSGIDWATLIRLIVKRYSERLEMVQYILNSTNPSNSASENKALAENVQVQLIAMLQPYMLSTVKPPQNPATSTEWVTPMYKLCATTYTNYINTSSLRPRLTPSENLILDGIHTTTREICRVVTGMWVHGIMAGLEPDYYKPSATDDSDIDLVALLDSWKEHIFGLMKWLDWSVWLKCRPACGFEVFIAFFSEWVMFLTSLLDWQEMCYLPMWPFGRGSDENHESDDPQPRCVRRMAPFDDHSF
ncbi:hypothetical protein J3R30DRAFT_2600952 [Lentinula aciculospora]|uniref:Uncharacterized protein n=1 Tax=Lentinula aciculospora TaxID=153920 RepID=A0A9W9DQ30_9AGAR|nr:hypothetical protein J3R30DRAFT_2600952 [Lentinula aciculospora]